ncbi:MAG: major capsid protein [Succinivibrionaceae bacterium]|nr:major capsid protein [Succinivibrionaceae bacterium]
MDIYTTAAQLKAIELLPRVYTWLFDTFCKDQGCVEDEKAIYDYMKGTQRMAPVVHPGTGGVVMPRDGYSTRQIGFCTIAPERIIENNDLLGRSFGEKVLGAMTPQERERKMLARDLTEMRAAIQRRREHMARQVLLTGKLSLFKYTNEGRDKEPTVEADYGFTNFYTVDSGKEWNTAGADINGDMQEIYDLVYDGLGQISVMVMAPDVANALLNNSKYVKFFDGRNIDMGAINTRYVGQGVRFIGWNADGVELYSLSGKYLDDDGTMKPLLPSGKLIAGSKGMLNVFHGPVTQVEKEDSSAQHITYIKKEVPLRHGSIDASCIMNRLTSCPTIVPANVDGWAVATVL